MDKNRLEGGRHNTHDMKVEGRILSVGEHSRGKGGTETTKIKYVGHVTRKFVTLCAH